MAPHRARKRSRCAWISYLNAGFYGFHRSFVDSAAMQLWSMALLAGLTAVGTLMRAEYRYLDDMGGFMRISTLLAVAACLGENSCISFYRLYHYSDDWGVFLAQLGRTLIRMIAFFFFGADLNTGRNVYSGILSRLTALRSVASGLIQAQELAWLWREKPSSCDTSACESNYQRLKFR